MQNSVPAFAYRVPTCPFNGPGCIKESRFDNGVRDMWEGLLQGSEIVAQTLLAEWDMATRSAIEQGRSQIYLYVPPCMAAIELAISITRHRSAAVVALFQREENLGISYPNLPCKIRVDDRLSGEGCARHDPANTMALFNSLLKNCAAKSHQIPGMDRLEIHAGGGASGQWVADKFDVPYVDQRAHELSNAGTGGTETTALSVQTITNSITNQNKNTGIAIISNYEALEAFAAKSSPSRADTSIKFKPYDMYKMMPQPDGDWIGTYYANFPISKKLSHTARYAQDKADREAEPLSWSNFDQPHQIDKMKKMAIGKAKGFAQKMMEKKK